MIYWLPNAQMRSFFSKQTNNAFEAAYKTLGNTGWLEDCGPTGALNVASALGVILTPKMGNFEPQAEDVVTLWFHDYRNFPAMRASRANLNPENIMRNRVPQYYPPMFRQVFDLNAGYREGVRFDDIVNLIKKGFGVLACMIKPGHYIAMVGYDDSTDELIYWDSWPERFQDGDGFNRRFPRKDANNLQNWCVVAEGKK